MLAAIVLVAEGEDRCLDAVLQAELSQLDTLSSLTSIPLANLLLILVGMPLIAVTGGWLLAGREPSAIGRRPLE